MNIKEQILSKLYEFKMLTGQELCKLFGISRQALNKHIQMGIMLKNSAGS
jgi:biotin operon repressor